MKTVLITGTSRGIGRETAFVFARRGYKVFATMRNPERAADFKQQMEDESLPIHIYQMDVNSDDSVKQCIDKINKEHGNIDFMINNAGIERHGSVEEVPMEDFKIVIDTNFFGVVRCMKAVLTTMRKNNNGCIINIGSVAGKIALSPLVPYCASKFALEAITEALAQEVKPFNIRVHLVEPGIINTDMAYGLSHKNISLYPQVRRFPGFYVETLKTPTPTALVAEKILEIAESGTWQFRHPVGTNAEPFLNWRATMNDEEWIKWNAQEDKEWYNAVESTFGMNCRQEKLEREREI